MSDGSQATAPAGWFPDPLQRGDLRYWDGAVWTEWAMFGGERRSDPVAGGPASGAAPALPRTGGLVGPPPVPAGSLAGTAVSLAGGGGSWQVVVGSQLPAFAPLARVRAGGWSMVRRVVGGPVVSLGIVAACSVIPVLVTSTEGAGALGLLRAGLAVAAVLGAAVAGRLSGPAAVVARALPLAFAAAQLVALVPMVAALTAGDASLLSMLPFAISLGLSVVVAVRAAFSLRPARAAVPPAPPPPALSGGAFSRPG